MSGVFENTLCSTPYQGDYLATASATADALDLSQTAALIEREGLRFDGTAGAVISGGGIPAVGTGDWSLTTYFKRTLGTYETIIGGGGSTVLAVRIYDGGVDVLLQNSVSTAFIGTIPASGILAVTKASGLMTVLINGAQIDTAKSDSNNYATGESTLGLSYAGATPTYINGALSHFYKWNYALTAGEIAALTRRGLVTLPEQRGGSMVALNTSAFTNLNMDSFSGASTTGFTSSSTGNKFAQSNPSIAAKLGQKFLVTFTATITGAATTIYLNSGSNIASVSNGANSIVLIATGNGSGAVIFNQVSIGTLVISNFSIIPLGTLFEQDSGQRNAGYMVGDTSGNKLDLILPATGVSIIDPAQRGVIRFTTNLATNVQIGGSQVIIPTNARISSWVINSSGTPNVTLGNVSAGAQYRASAAVVAGDNQITLLTPFTTTGNLWVNSSTTATLKHTIMWEYIQ